MVERIVKRPVAAIKNATEYRGGVDGIKMFLGATLIVFSHQCDMLRDLIANFPEIASLHTILFYVDQITIWAKYALENMGELLIWVGALHKIWKLGAIQMIAKLPVSILSKIKSLLPG